MLSISRESRGPRRDALDSPPIPTYPYKYSAIPHDDVHNCGTGMCLKRQNIDKC